MVRSLVDNDGITYIQVDTNGDAVTNGDGTAVPGPWHLDALPLLISAADWDTLESGLVQRSRLLDAVLTDLYGPRRSVTSGVFPAQLLFAHPGYVRAARGIEVPGRHQLFLHACDISRAADGEFRVNADWTQAPSGAGYALADRRVVAHAIPDLYERIGPRPASPWAQALRLALIDAAPESAEEPVVVVLSPGIHSETAFDQAYLASVLGFPLVESADLVVRDGKLWMRSLGTLKRVDVVLRRVDADYTDPLDLRADSRLGVVGLVEVLRRGAVTVVNTLGSGILESPGLLRFLPELAEPLLGETPLLETAPVYWGGINRRAFASVEQVGVVVDQAGDRWRHDRRPRAVGEATRSRLRPASRPPRGSGSARSCPQFSSAPTDFHPGGLSSASVGMRLFTVSQRGGYAPMIGGLGYLLAPGNAAYTMKTVAAKDIWVRTPTRVTAERIPTAAGGTAGDDAEPHQGGQLAARAVRPVLDGPLRRTRREHGPAAHRHPRALPRVPLPAGHGGQRMCAGAAGRVGQITGTDTGAGGDTHEMIATAPTTLWSLTADRHRPGSLAQSVERLGLAARAVRDQMSNDTWMVLAAVERALLNAPDSPPESQTEGDAFLSSTSSQTLAGMLALSGVAAESMVQDVGWNMMDIGKRIERGLALTALLRASLTTVRSPGAEQTITESALVACESSVIYRRRTLGKVSVAAVADLVLFDAENPRSLVYQLERLRANLKALPSSSGSSRPERLVDEIATRLRRLDPADLEGVTPDGTRAELADLLDGMHSDLRDLSGVITATHLSLPGGMQPLWGPDERRALP